MEHAEDAITFGPSDSGERVAAYQTIHGAALATHQLITAGFDEHDIVVAPADVQPLPTGHRHDPWRRHSMAATVAGLGFLGTFGLSTMVTTLSTLAGAALALLVAVVAGVTTSVIRGNRASAAEEREQRVVAKRFEVLCKREPRRAMRELARWWDPSAVPVVVQPTREGPVAAR